MATSPSDHEFRSCQPANTRYLQSQIFDLFHGWIFDHTNLKFTMKEKCKEFPRLPNQNDQSVKMHWCHPRWMRPLGSGQIWRQSTIRGGGCHTREGEQGIPWWAQLPWPPMKCTLLEGGEGYMQLWSAFAFGLVIRDLICKGVPENVQSDHSTEMA